MASRFARLHLGKLANGRSCASLTIPSIASLALYPGHLTQGDFATVGHSNTGSAGGIRVIGVGGWWGLLRCPVGEAENAGKHCATDTPSARSPPPSPEPCWFLPQGLCSHLTLLHNCIPLRCSLLRAVFPDTFCPLCCKPLIISFPALVPQS